MFTPDINKGIVTAHALGLRGPATHEMVTRSARYISQGHGDWALALFLNSGVDYASALDVLEALVPVPDSVPAT